MLPDEAQVIMAKVLFFIFATCLLCLGRANATQFEHKTLQNQPLNAVHITKN